MTGGRVVRLRESMGVCADSAQKAFPSQDIDAFMKRVVKDIPVDMHHHDLDVNTNHIIVGARRRPCPPWRRSDARARRSCRPGRRRVVSVRGLLRATAPERVDSGELCREVSQSLVWPHLRQHCDEHQKRVRVLARLLDESGHDEGEHALV